MAGTIRKKKYARDRFDAEAAMERDREQGLLGRGRDRNGDWFGEDTRGHNQQSYDECVAGRGLHYNPMNCPCKKCERAAKERMVKS